MLVKVNLEAAISFRSKVKDIISKYGDALSMTFNPVEHNGVMYTYLVVPKTHKLLIIKILGANHVLVDDAVFRDLASIPVAVPRHEALSALLRVKTNMLGGTHA